MYSVILDPLQFSFRSFRFLGKQRWLDIWKTLDQVWYQKLLNKLQVFGIRIKFCTWVSSFLANPTTYILSKQVLPKGRCKLELNFCYLSTTYYTARLTQFTACL